MPTRKQESAQVSREVASFVEGKTLGEVTYDPVRLPPIQFALFGNDGEVISYENDWTPANGRKLIPRSDKGGLVSQGVVLLASRAQEYGSHDELLAEIIEFVRRYTDVPPFWEILMAHYVMMSWVFDRFTAVPYLRFLGEPQSGKTRCLQVIGHLCYKAIIGGGATSASPLFRLLDVYGGTFVIDEADYRYSELNSEIVKILNCGYMRGLSVLRSEKRGDEYEPRAFNVFGPKVLTTRREFQDHALETRCLTLRTTDRKVRSCIPRQLPAAFYSEALTLRNKLLAWRFENFFRINSSESELLGLEARLTQIGAPLWSVSTDENFQARLVKFLRDQAIEQHADRPQVIVAEAIRQLLSEVRKWPASLTVKEVCEKAREVVANWETETDFSPKRTGNLVRSLGFAPRRINVGYQFAVTRASLADLVERYPPLTGQGGGA